MCSSLVIRISHLLYFTDDDLQFVFKYIDPNDHEAPFVFTVKIDESGTYNSK